MPRPSRRYDRRLEVWDYLVNPDTYGGNTANTNSRLGTIWCDVSTIPQNKLNEYGLDINQVAIEIYTRDGSHIDFDQNNLLIKNGSDEYSIYAYTPTDIDGQEIQILAIK